MQCVQCGEQNDDRNKYCESCGAQLKIRCEACGHSNEAASRYCGQCGSEVVAAPIDDNKSSQQILRSLSIKGGERKRLTVLFADIRNSTSLIDSLGDPELGMRLLDPVLAVMKDAVHRYDGIVNKMQGDGVMALFGAPRPQEDHAVRGCLAALAMQDAISRLGDKDIRIRVGVHTGEVVVQTVENSIYQTYDVVGANAHLANRLEQMADGDFALITGDTYRAAKQFVEVEALGPKTIRGIGTAIEVFKLKGLRNAPASEVFRSGVRLSQLVGRDDQFAALERELANTIKGDGRVVGLVGEAGIGKSRLCFEFADNCRRRGIRVVEARVLAHGRATPFQPVLALLRDILGVQPNESADVSRHRVAERFAALSGSEPVLHVLLEFLGLADPTRPLVKADPKTRKMQLLEFVRTLARSVPRDSATVVVIEDLHWIDAASEEFVEALADAVVGTTVLLVVNFRPGFTAPLMQRSHYRQINMPPLATGEAQILFRECCGEDTSLALIGRNIIERAHGNPFFLEELVNVLVERGELQGEKGAYRLKGGIDVIPLPATVQAVIGARIDRLGERAKQVLETAAVIGREFLLSILMPVTGLSNADLAETLWQLRQAELLYDLPPYERGMHAFRHPLIQEVAYRTLLLDRRRSLHGAVAKAIETSKDRSEEHAGLLAYHLEHAGETLKAAQQNMRAAMWVGANDPAQALRSWKKVRELLLDQPSSQPIDYLRMVASGQIVNFGWREGIAADDAKVYFEEAKQFAIAAKDMRANALINAAYGRILANGGSADEYVQRILEAKALTDGGSSVSVQITLKAILCHALRLSGRMTEALQMNIEAMDRAHEIVKFDRQTLGFDIEVWLTAMRGQTLVMLGRGDEARAFLDRVLEKTEGEVDAIHHVIPSLAYVDLAWAHRDPQMALEHANRAFSLAAKSGNPYLRVYAQACRGLAQTVAGSPGAAVEDLSGALRFARSRKAGLENEARILADLADAYRRNGDAATALETAREAISVAVARHTRASECLARIVLTAILLGSSSSDQRAAAREELSRARQLMTETGTLIYGSTIRGLGGEDLGFQPTPAISIR
jgi:class 3 adenylate cyclase/tetratricopeptide (TPR) repeat protein